MRPNYNQIYFLKIAHIIFRLQLSDQLSLFDHWSKYFQSNLNNFFIKSDKYDYTIKFTGPLSIKRRISQTNPIITLPTFKGKTCYLNHLLHPNFFHSALRTMIASDLQKRQLLLLHSASFLTFKNKAVLIVGKPGDGKSTTLRKLVPPLLPLSDDMTLLSIQEGQIMAYPSPFNSKLSLSQTPNQAFPVSGVIFPSKSTKLSVIKTDSTTALFNLLDQTLLPLKSKKITKIALEYLRPLSLKTYFLKHRIHDDILDTVEKIFKNDSL